MNTSDTSFAPLSDYAHYVDDTDSEPDVEEDLSYVQDSPVLNVNLTVVELYLLAYIRRYI